MIRQSFINAAAIEDIQKSTHYWVNVGVHKYFTTDLTEATVFYNSVGDSLYKSPGGYCGELILETVDAPDAYFVEVELVAKEGSDDSDQSENWTSAQLDQSNAHRVYSNARELNVLKMAYSPNGLENTDHFMVRLRRSGAGTIEYIKVNVPA